MTPSALSASRTGPAPAPADARSAPSAGPPAPGRVYLSSPHMAGTEEGLVAEAFASNWIAPAGPARGRLRARVRGRRGRAARRGAQLRDGRPAPGAATCRGARGRRGAGLHADVRGQREPHPRTWARAPCSWTASAARGTWTRPCWKRPLEARRARGTHAARPRAGAPVRAERRHGAHRRPAASATASPSSRTRPRRWARPTMAAPRARSARRGSSRSTATRSSPPPAAGCSWPDRRRAGGPRAQAGHAGPRPRARTTSTPRWATTTG